MKRHGRRHRLHTRHIVHHLKKRKLFWPLVFLLLAFGTVGGILLYNYINANVLAAPGFKTHYSKGGKVGSASDRILVKFKTSAGTTRKNQIYAKYGLTKKSTVGRTAVEVLSVPSGSNPKDLTATIKGSEKDAVEFAETDDILAPEVIPNDPYYAIWQWQLRTIQAPSAWDMTHADGVIVGVCDTGFDALHPDLSGIFITSLGYNTASENTDWSPVMYHGTAVAGVVSAVTDNGIGVAGTAWGARIIPVRVSNASNGVAYLSDLAECVTYVTDHGGKVVNLSYGGADTYTMNDAAVYAKSKGALVVMSAGNSSVQQAFPDFPSFVAVSATDQTDQLASFSSYGTYVDIAAPGVNILSTNWPDGGYARVNGTSFASPIVAGVAAMLYAADPSATPDEVASVLFTSADDLGPPGEDIYFGAGRVNAAKAVSKLLNMTIPSPQPTATPRPTATPTPTPTPAATPTPYPGYGNCQPVGNWGAQKYYDAVHAYLFVRGTNHGEFNEPRHIAIGQNGNLYVADWMNYRIQVLDSGMHYVTEWQLPSENVQYERRPSGIAIAPNGQFWVVDNWNSRVIIYDAAGNVLKIFGSRGSGNGQFNMPDSIAIDAQGYAYITDRWNYRIEKFDSQGNFVAKWGSQGSGNGQFDFPAGIAVGPDSRIYVTDTLNSRVQMFMPDGTFIGSFGSKGTVGTDASKVGMYPGLFNYPEDIGFDSAGNIYVVDSLNHRVQQFDQNRMFVTMWGSYGTGAGFFNTPSAVVVDAGGDVYVSDRGNSRISKFTCKK